MKNRKATQYELTSPIFYMEQYIPFSNVYFELLEIELELLETWIHIYHIYTGCTEKMFTLQLNFCEELGNETDTIWKFMTSHLLCMTLFFKNISCLQTMYVVYLSTPPTNSWQISNYVIIVLIIVNYVLKFGKCQYNSFRFSIKRSKVVELYTENPFRIPFGAESIGKE